jgi:hypothetical protein
MSSRFLVLLRRQSQGCESKGQAALQMRDRFVMSHES